MSRRFSQVDVFTDVLTLGNAVAVVHDADGFDDDALRPFAAPRCCGAGPGQRDEVQVGGAAVVGIRGTVAL